MSVQLVQFVFDRRLVARFYGAPLSDASSRTKHQCGARGVLLCWGGHFLLDAAFNKWAIGTTAGDHARCLPYAAQAALCSSSKLQEPTPLLLLVPVPSLPVPVLLLSLLLAVLLIVLELVLLRLLQQLLCPMYYKL